MSQTISLKKAFSKQILRWTLLGLAGTAGLALILVVYLGVQSTETTLSIAAETAAKAFRPQIISSNDAIGVERQIRDAFHLSPLENVAIRDSKLKRVYERGAKSQDDLIHPSCTSGKICWSLSTYRVSTLVPIYFDGDRKEVKAYLQLELIPRFNFPLLFAFFFAIFAGSLIQAFGISRRFIQLFSSVGDQLEQWADHIRDNPKSPLGSTQAPFDELYSLHAALSGLNEEIRRLEVEAQDSAKLSIIRGIGHDILSPVSRLQKLWEVWMSTTTAGRQPTEELVERTRQSLRRLAAIAQQTRILQPSQQTIEQAPSLDIGRETESLIIDLSKDDDIEAKEITIARLETSNTLLARVRSEDYLRIVDNLVRNAVHASESKGRIELSTRLEGKTPMLVVRDYGRGIPEEIQSKVFDLNFTTRPGSGTGLGLTIVKQLCERNQAKIDFTSQVGVGTEFRVMFNPGTVISEAVV